ncbi:ESX-4 secretion system protein eccD4 [Mycolicibacterium cyprinidarum]|nr:ESX-4 secretion system protein eccD4 [Mycolicibacterium sp. NGTWS1803]
MPDTLCRLAIHATGTTDIDVPATLDVTLPSDCPVAVLIPPIVDIVVNGPIAAAEPRRWCLTRVGGELLDTSMTLRENAVHDGELILLTTAPFPMPRSRPVDSSGVVVEVADQTLPAVLHGAVTAAGLFATVVGAATLAWTGVAAGTSTHLWTAALLAAVSATGAVVIGRPAKQSSAVLSLAAVAFAMVTGFLAGPGAPWASAFLLTASSGFAVSIVMLHMTDGNRATLTAFAAITSAIAVVAVIGVTTQLPAESAGALLTVVSLAALSGAPKLTVAAAGVGPLRPEIGDRRAAFAHRVLTGLVAGWASSAALGVAVVTAAALTKTGAPAVAVMFAADVGLLLLLRQRTHFDVRRRVGLGAAGLCALTGAHIAAVSAAPKCAPWLCAAAVVTGVGAVAWTAITVPPNPVVRHALQMLEYLSLAAVVPLSAWVAGAYGLVRDLSLP